MGAQPSSPQDEAPDGDPRVADVQSAPFSDLEPPPSLVLRAAVLTG